MNGYLQHVYFYVEVKETPKAKPVDLIMCNNDIYSNTISVMKKIVK